MILKEKKHSNQRELGKFIILSYSYNEATVNKHKLTGKRMSVCSRHPFYMGSYRIK